MERAFVLRIFAVLAVAAAATLARAERWLWTSPNGDAEVLDQSQATIGPYAGMQNGHGVGQSFVPRASVLHRLDLMLFNRHDRRPFSIRLWEWVDGDGDGVAEDGEYAATVARPPLWTDRLALAGPPERQLVAFYPKITLRVGRPHYIELSNDTGDGEWTAYTAESATGDPYASGAARLNGRFQLVPATQLFVDLWFRSYGPPVGGPAPLTCEDTGQPAPCFSAPGAWVGPGPELDPPDADDYRAIVEAYADYGRAAALAGDGSSAHEYALYDAFLYRVTGDETFAASAVALLAKSLVWREADQSFYSYFWLEYPGWAYRWVANSPTLTPGDHARIRRLLVLHGIGLWPNVEAGMDNHALACALGLKLVTDLVPAGEFALHSGGAVGAADHAAWKAFADAHWTEFKVAFDIWEDASQYHYFELRHILELSELYGEQGILWSSPAFRALVERGFAAHTPLGPYALYGDTLGWSETWGTASWVLERAARELRDPKYRWLARRVFAYHRSHVRSTRTNGTPIEYWQAVYNEYPAFCHAYFAYDPSVPAAQPAALTPAFAARQDTRSDTAWRVGVQGLGQTFIAQASPLVRLDLRVRDGGAPVLGEVRLWRWLGGHSATLASTPVHAERLDLSSGGAWRTITLQPFLDVQVGASYFVEIRAEGTLDLAGSPLHGVDRYAGGMLWSGNQGRANADLWFQSWTLAGRESTTTDRLEARWRRPTQFGTPPRPMDFTGQRVPDKLVLQSGFDPDDLQLVVNLIGGDYYHGQEETGSVLSLTDGGARLLADGTYFDRLDQHHAVPIVRRYAGTRREVVEPVRVLHLRDWRQAAVARVSWGDRDGWPVDHERRFFLVKNRFVLVRDRTGFTDSIEASAGPLWSAYDVRPESGPNWFDLYDHEPRSVNGLRFANPERYVLLWFVPRTGAEIAEWREIRTGNPPSPSYLVAQRWTGSAAAGDARWFDSLLVPHGPEPRPADLAAAIAVLHDDGTAIALRVRVDDETWTIVDNPDHVSIQNAAVATDATYAITRTVAGEPDYVLSHEATFLRVVDGSGRTIDRAWLAPSSVEVGTERLPPRGARRVPSYRPERTHAEDSAARGSR